MEKMPNFLFFTDYNNCIPLDFEVLTKINSSSKLSSLKKKKNTIDINSNHQNSQILCQIIQLLMSLLRCTGYFLCVLR
jgi:hypothetical protein